MERSYAQLTWPKIVLTVAVTAAVAAAFGYLIGGWPGAVALAGGIVLGLTPILGRGKAHPAETARGERPFGGKLSLIAMSLIVVAVCILVAVGDGRDAARLIPGLILIGAARLWRHARGDAAADR